jgi:hypothetical protein
LSLEIDVRLVCSRAVQLADLMKISRPPRPSEDVETMEQSNPVTFYVTLIMLFSTIPRSALLEGAQVKNLL